MEGATLAVSIVALIVAGVGWIVSYRLNARTQRQLLVDSLTNEARLALTETIRDLHEWCSDASSLASSMPVDDITSLGQTAQHHWERSTRLRELVVDSRRLIWLQRLEEYEPLFQGTATVRVDMLNMLEAACKSASDLADQHAPGSPPPEDRLDAFGAEVFDVLALTWDLLIYIQNTSIGRLTGNKIPERIPADPKSIRLVADKQGVLSICRPES